MGVECYSELKLMARLAKSRMKSGYWINRKEKLKECLESGVVNAFEEDAVKLYFKAGHAVKSKKTAEEIEDDRIYPIVCRIIDDDDGLNPLGRLIDRNLYDSMGDAEKQRYVFELSERYKRLSNRYYHEKEIEKRLETLAKR